MSPPPFARVSNLMSAEEGMKGPDDMPPCAGDDYDGGHLCLGGFDTSRRPKEAIVFFGPRAGRIPSLGLGGGWFLRQPGLLSSMLVICITPLHIYIFAHLRRHDPQPLVQ